jgi:3-oxoacyl-[acyl-carrier-protein] synthase III
MTFGIVAIGECLGEKRGVAEEAAAYLEDPDRAEGWGYRRFHRAPDSVGLTDLGAEAGRRALCRAGVRPDDVDVMVFAMADIPEYLYWDPAAASAFKVGVRHAEAVLINQACSAGVASFDIVAGKFATHPGYRVALLVTANRVCEAYWNRMDSSTAIMSDGAAAAVLVRGHPSCVWLSTEVISDGRYADFSRLASGGAARPFRAGDSAPEPIGNPVDLMNEFLGHDLRAVVGFVRMSRERSLEVVERACKRADIKLDTIRYFFHVNGNARALADYAALFRVPKSRTNAEVAAEHGHFGCADQLLAFGRALTQRQCRPGDVVALTSIGNGMHWACTLIRV